MSLWVPALRQHFRVLLRLDDPPWRIALALAVGVFISCTPFYFFQTLLALLTATLLRLNKAATVLGAWLNLPWFAPFLYAAAFRIGTWLVAEGDGAPQRGLRVLLAQPSTFSWDEATTLIQSLSLALFVGTTIMGVVAGAATYVVALGLISAKRSRGNGPGQLRSRRAAGNSSGARYH